MAGRRDASGTNAPQRQDPEPKAHPPPTPVRGSIHTDTLGCLALAGLDAALLLASVGYGASLLCLPYTPPKDQPAALGFTMVLVMINSLCFLALAGTYIKLYCDLPQGNFKAMWDYTMKLPECL